MEKFCVFCGKGTVAKTMEHVIPRWLIKETGDPKRKVPLGIDYELKKMRKFSFDQLKFPACEICNNDFSKLEGDAKSVFINVLNEAPISARSLNILLTWFDKIRIGLWLGYYYLDKNIYSIIPNFHVTKRINEKDRMLLIYKTVDTRKGLGIMFVNTPFFGHWPSCFGLAINQFYFINISSDFLLSRRLGLPFPKIKIVSENLKGFYTQISKGLERILTPLLRISYDDSCKEIYQPIIPNELPEWKNLDVYKTPYVRNFFKSSRFGKILIKKSTRDIVEYPRNKSKLWLPNIQHSRTNLEYMVCLTIIKLQNFLLNDLPSLEYLGEEEKRRHKNAYKQVKQFNNYLQRRVERELKPKT